MRERSGLMYSNEVTRFFKRRANRLNAARQKRIDAYRKRRDKRNTILTKDGKYVIINNVDNIKQNDYICTDADNECKAKDPTNCRVHGIIRIPSKSITEVYNAVGDGKRLKVVSVESKSYTFAGKGSKKPLRIEPKLINDYGGTSGNWSHGRQKMKVDNDGKELIADVHYYYEPTIGYVEQRIKIFYKK